MTPRLSVLTTCRGHARWLAESVRSVRHNSGHFEHIVVVDGMDDADSLRVADQLWSEDPKLKIILHMQRLGHAAAMNTAAFEARGDWVLKVDADDTIAPSYVASILAAADMDPALNVIFSWCHLFGLEDRVWKYPDFNRDEMATRHMIPGPAAFRRSLVVELGGWDTTMTCAEDWDFYVRAEAAVGLRVHQIPAALWNYRQHDGERMTKIGQDKLPEYQKRWQQLLSKGAAA